MKKFFLFFAALTITYPLFGQQTFSDFQEAVCVIGQPGFHSSLMNFSDSVTFGPTSVAVSSKGMLAVAEQFGSSVKIWYTLPETDGEPADVEVGNPGFSIMNNGPSRQFAESFDGVAWSPDGNKLIATCGSQNRVLIWNSVPQKNGQPADVVVGQPDFNSIIPGTTQTTFDHPCGVLVTPSGKLLVSDYYNNRVLIWNSIPEKNGAPADYVIGQKNFRSNKPGDEADELYGPRGISLSPDGRLLITCSSSHHVFIYDSIPGSKNEVATVVIGQKDFGLSTSGTSDSTLFNPFDVLVTPAGQLAIGEYGNNRVMIYNAMPTVHGVHADHVLGQPGFFTGKLLAPSGSPDNNNFNRVYGMSADLNGRLFVSGRDMNRVMIFGKLPAKTADLAVSISVMDTVLCEMSHVLCQFNIVNNGPDTAFNVIATAAFPQDYSLDNYIIGDGFYLARSGHWVVPAIAPGRNVSLLLEGTVNPGTSGKTLTTYAGIIGSSARDQNLRNNGTSVDVSIYSLVLPEMPKVNDVMVCSGTSALLTTAEKDSLLWYTGEYELYPVAAGSSYLTDPLTEATTFYVEARTVCSSTPRVPVHVDILPVFHQEETITVCSGDGYTFPDGQVQVNITDTLIHTSYLSSVYGCDSIVMTTVVPNPSYSISETDTLCSGESYTFPDGTIQHGITSSLTHTSHFVTVTGCDSTIVTYIYVSEVDASVSRDGVYLKAVEEGADYQWIDVDNDSSLLAGETRQVFMAANNGNYAVIINKDGCSVISDSYPVVIQGLEKNTAENQIKGYPNPVKDRITLDFPYSCELVHISLFNLNNQLITSRVFNNVNQSLELNLEEFRSGTYLMRVSTDSQNDAVLRIVKE